jgi:hypothetical protein
MARKTDTIISSITAGLQARHPGMRDFSANSALSVLTEVIALQLRYEEQLIDSKAEALTILTATGDDLDALVTDRGLTRQVGTKSVGQITFSRRNPAATPITVPVGVKLAMSPEDGSAPVYFVTTAAGSFGVGDTQCVVDAEAYIEGENGNVGAYTITTIMSLPSGVDSATNPLPFSGGSDEESDDDLRTRYIYAIWTDGRATPKLIVEHLNALESVLEAQVFTCDYGDVEIVCDVAALPDDPPAEVGVCIEDNLAAGVTARGVLAATIVSGGSVTGIDDTRGGKIVLRASEEIINNDTVVLDYTTWLGDTHQTTINVPGGTHRGDVVVATLQDADDLAIGITGDNGYSGPYHYDVLIGLGTYPYLWIMPEMVLITVQIYVTQTATPEANLGSKIEASVEAFLDDYEIGDDFELSDLVEWIKFDYVQYAEDGTFYRFQGIDNFTVQCTGKGMVKTALGDTITIENDERVEPGAITAHMS